MFIMSNRMLNKQFPGPSIFKLITDMFIISVIALDATKYFFISNAFIILFITSAFVLFIATRTTMSSRTLNSCVLLILFCIVSAISLFWCGDYPGSVIRLRSVILITIMQIFIILTLEEGYIQHIEKCILIGTFVLVMIVLIEGGGIHFPFNESGRLGTGIVDSNAFGKLLALSSIISLHFFITKKEDKYLIIYLLLIALVVLTQSRSAILLAVVFSVALFMVHRNKFKRWQVIMLIVFLMLAFFVLYSVGFINYFFERIFKMLAYYKTGNEFYDYSAYSRLMLKKVGVQCFLNKPILGYGIGMSGLLLDNSYFHDNYIQISVELGLVGLFTYYLPFVICLRRIYKNKNYLLVIIILFLMFSDIYNTTYYQKFSRIIFAMCMLSCCKSHRTNS